MPITIEIPTQQQLLAMRQNPNTLLNQFTAAHTPKPAVGSPGAVTAAGAVPGGSVMPGGNLNNLNNPDWITSMSDMINQINMKAQQEANASRIPGAAGLEKQSSANIASLMGGNLPDDVFREIQQRGAEQGVFSGSPLGANSTAGIMQALGLTSFDMTNQGQKLLTEAYGRNPSGPLANPQGLVTTPAQAEALRLQQQNMELDYLARMAAINAANNRTRAGYGGGGGGYPRGGGGGGGFAPATNWQGGGQTPITEPWHLGYDPSAKTGGPPPNTIYNPNTDTSDYLPYGPNLYDVFGGPPPNTIYNPNTDTSDFMPYGPNLYGEGGGNSQSYDQLTEEEWEDLYGAGG